MKNISLYLITIFIVISSISADAKKECTTKAMDVNQAERKECEKKANKDEKKSCNKESMDKLVAAKKECQEGSKK